MGSTGEAVAGGASRGFHQPAKRWKNYNCQQRIRLSSLIAVNLLPALGPWPGPGGHLNGLAQVPILGGFEQDLSR